MSSDPAAARPAFSPWAAGALWLVAAFAITLSGALQRLRPPAPQLLIAALTLALVVAYRMLPGFAVWARSLDPRTILAFHLTRFVGFYFLVLHGRGELPRAFAVPGGWGDIAVATLAALLLATWPAYDAARRRQLVLAWNILGFADILLVVVTAARLALAEPGSMQALLRFPLGLLPTFLVPLIIASHLLLFRRQARA
jgi:hypothetical protein